MNKKISKKQLIIPPNLVAFKGQKIRRHWDEENEKWWFSIVDVISALTESKNPPVYWRVLKKRLIDEGSSETVTKCNGLKMLASDGKMRKTDCAGTEGVFRIIQSIPSPKAEPFKIWLSRVGYERVEEMEDPEKAIQRAMRFYLKRGYSKNWINQRLKSIEIRKELTDEWEERGIKIGKEFAILTDVITLAWAGIKTKNYKKYKNLKKENLRDNMTNLELVLNMLAEASTTEISKKKKPKNFTQNKQVAKEGGSIAGEARRKLEKKTGKKIISKLNAKKLGLLK